MVRAYRQGTIDRSESPVSASSVPVLPEVLPLIDSAADGMTAEQRVAKVAAYKKQCTTQLEAERPAAQMLKRQIELWQHLSRLQNVQDVPLPPEVPIAQLRMLHALQQKTGMVSLQLPEGVENFSVLREDQQPKARLIEAGDAAQQAYKNTLNVYACLYGKSVSEGQSSDKKSEAKAVAVPISADNFAGIFSYLTEYLLGMPTAYNTLFFIHFYETQGWAVSQTKKHIDNVLYHLFENNVTALHQFLSWLSTSSYAAQIPVIVAQPLVKAAIAIHAEALLAKTPVPRYMDIPVVFEALVDAHHAGMLNLAYVMDALDVLVRERDFYFFCREHRAGLAAFFTKQELVILPGKKPLLTELLKILSICSFFAFCLKNATVWQEAFGITSDQVKEAAAEDRVMAELFSLRGDKTTRDRDVTEMIGHLKSLSCEDFAVFCKAYKRPLIVLFKSFQSFHQLFRALVEPVQETQSELPAPAEPENKKAERKSNEDKFTLLLSSLFPSPLDFSSFSIADADNNRVIEFLIYLPIRQFRAFICCQSKVMQKLFSSPLNFHKLCCGISKEKDGNANKEKKMTKLDHFVKRTFQFQNIISLTDASPEADVHRVLSFLPTNGIEEFCVLNRAQLLRFYGDSTKVQALLDRESESIYVMYILDAIGFKHVLSYSASLPRLFTDLSVSQFRHFVTERAADLPNFDKIVPALTALDPEKRRKFFRSMPGITPERVEELLALDAEKKRIFFLSMPLINAKQVNTLLTLLPEELCAAFFKLHNEKLLDFICFDYRGGRSTLAEPNTEDGPGLKALKRLLIQTLKLNDNNSWAKPYRLSFSKPVVPDLISKLRDLALISERLSFDALCQELAKHCNPKKTGQWLYADICLALESCQPKRTVDQKTALSNSSTSADPSDSSSSRQIAVLVQA